MNAQMFRSIIGDVSRALMGRQARPQVPMATTLFLERFAVDADLIEDNVCGGYDGQFQTTLSITCVQLDEAGFVTHNEDLIREIRDQFGLTTLRASCEELAGGIINVAYQKMGSRLMRATARVYNLTGYAEVHWNVLSGFPPPLFPQAVTREKREIFFDYGFESRRC